jgi:hypothetical protein
VALSLDLLRLLLLDLLLDLLFCNLLLALLLFDLVLHSAPLSAALLAAQLLAPLLICHLLLCSSQSASCSGLPLIGRLGLWLLNLLLDLLVRKNIQPPNAVLSSPFARLPLSLLLQPRAEPIQPIAELLQPIGAELLVRKRFPPKAASPSRFTRLSSFPMPAKSAVKLVACPAKQLDV